MQDTPFDRLRAGNAERRGRSRLGDWTTQRLSDLAMSPDAETRRRCDTGKYLEPGTWNLELERSESLTPKIRCDTKNE